MKRENWQLYGEHKEPSKTLKKTHESWHVTTKVMNSDEFGLREDTLDDNNTYWSFVKPQFTDFGLSKKEGIEVEREA